MIRRVLALASLVSLLLWIATAGIAILSYARPIGPIRLPGSTAASYRELALGHGHLAISLTRLPAGNPAAATAPFPGYPYGAEKSGWQAMGLQWRRESLTLQRPADRAVVVVLHRSATLFVWLGLPLLLFALLPAWWLIRGRTLVPQRPPGICPTCGYDLRASTDRCPECGTPIPAKS